MKAVRETLSFRTWLGLKGGAWKLDRGGFAEASRGLRENVPSFLAKPGLKRTVLSRSSSCNLPVVLS